MSTCMTKDEIKEMARLAAEQAKQEAEKAEAQARVDYTPVMVQCAAAGCDVTEEPNENLAIYARAIELGCAQDVLVKLCKCKKISFGDKIVLPRDHYETLSRGRGWCRMGKGDDVVWGKRHDDGYEVGPGIWHVGGSDGFKRKNDRKWVVEHVKVGSETWTIAK